MNQSIVDDKNKTGYCKCKAASHGAWKGRATAARTRVRRTATPAPSAAPSC